MRPKTCCSLARTAGTSRRSSSERACEPRRSSPIGHPVAVGPHRRIRGLEEVEEDASHLLGCVAFELRHAPLLGQHARLPGRDAAEYRQARDEHGGDGDRQPVATHELAEAVAHGVRLRENGAPIQETADLLAELAGRPVPATRLLTQGRQDDAIEVAAETTSQPPPVELVALELLRTASLGGVAVVGAPSRAPPS